VTEHGNHYHRPDCKFYKELPQLFWDSMKSGAEKDVYKEKCYMCVR
jgi:hypothetical protein